MPIIDDVAPDRASYRPGDTAHVVVTMTNDQPGDLRGWLSLVMAHLDRPLQEVECEVALASGETATVSVAVTPPAVPLRGYGLDATLCDDKGAVVASGSGALDVLERWSQAPRYGFLSDFAPETSQADGAARCDALGRYHLNVIQFYDWMWRHYRLLPPQDDFTDAMGRRLALTTVRATIAAVRERGGATMAYGAVYGAEPEFADGHPDLALYDEQGDRISLDRLFYIMNIAPGSPWVPLIVAEFAAAVRELGFDGIHLDQYGFPKTARTATGEAVNLADHFPPLIDAARAAVVAERPDAGVIFNAVENWPIETVASTSQDAVYIELWPPYDSYNDLRRLIQDGRRLSGGKQTILAAYLAPFLDADEQTLPQAEAAAMLTTATITASGGFHLLLGERDGLLCDPYYPKYATMRPAFAATMRAYADFLVRYEELFTALDMAEWEHGDEAACALTGSRLTLDAEPGAVWAITRRKPGWHIVHLINLFDQQDTNWNAPRTPPQPLDNLELTLSELPPIRRALFLSPDTHLGRPQSLPLVRRGGRMSLRLPQLHVWSVVALEVEDATA